MAGGKKTPAGKSFQRNAPPPEMQGVELYSQQVSKDNTAERTVVYPTTADGYSTTTRFYDFNTNTVRTESSNQSPTSQQGFDPHDTLIRSVSTIMPLSEASVAVQKEAAELKSKVGQLDKNVSSEVLEASGWLTAKKGAFSVENNETYNYLTGRLYSSSESNGNVRANLAPIMVENNIETASGSFEPDPADPISARFLAKVDTMRDKSKNYLQTAVMAGKPSGDELVHDPLLEQKPAPAGKRREAKPAAAPASDGDAVNAALKALISPAVPSPIPATDIKSAVGKEKILEPSRRPRPPGTTQ